jgi:hypothetical protein
MFNPLLILYIFLIIFFVVGVFAIVYHLIAYRFNLQVSLFVITFFLLGSLLLLGINVYFAAEINWSEMWEGLFSPGMDYPV